MDYFDYKELKGFHKFCKARKNACDLFTSEDYYDYFHEKKWPVGKSSNLKEKLLINGYIDESIADQGGVFSFTEKADLVVINNAKGFFHFANQIFSNSIIQNVVSFLLGVASTLVAGYLNK